MLFIVKDLSLSLNFKNLTKKFLRPQGLRKKSLTAIKNIEFLRPQKLLEEFFK